MAETTTIQDDFNSMKKFIESTVYMNLDCIEDSPEQLDMVSALIYDTDPEMIDIIYNAEKVIFGIYFLEDEAFAQLVSENVGKKFVTKKRTSIFKFEVKGQNQELVWVHQFNRVYTGKKRKFKTTDIDLLNQLDKAIEKEDYILAQKIQEKIKLNQNKKK